MNPWLLGLELVALGASLSFVLLGVLELRKSQARNWKLLHEKLQIHDHWLETIDHDVLQVLKLLNQPKPPEPETGAFLPSDEDAARMEQMLLGSEDRFISGRPTPSSSAPTTTSRSNSRTAASTRPARNSGPR